MSSSPTTSSQAPSTPPMYFCHECSIEIRPLMLPNPTCPRCSGEFVEEIDPSNPIPGAEQNDDDDEPMQMFGLEPQRPFTGATRRSDVDGSSPPGQGLDLGTLMGGILRGLATAGSQPRAGARASGPSSTTANQGSTTSEANSNAGDGSSNGNFRSGTSQVGPLNFSWGMGSYQTTYPIGNRTGSASNNNPSTAAPSNDNPFASRSPMGLNEYVRRSFDNHQHDDGMGGAGGAADGRFFNMDNQTGSRRGEEGENAANESTEDDRGYPPELSAIRDVFANLFGGMGDGPASMLVDLFGGGMGRGRTGDYVWGQQGLDDVITQLMEQTRGSTAPPPASEEAIAKLERFTRKDKIKLEQARNRECSTCMDSFQEEDEGEEPSMDSNRLSSTLGGNLPSQDADDPPEVMPQDEQQDELIMMPCKHLFHEDCLLPWLKTNGTCPVCRVSLEPEKSKRGGEGEGANTRPGQPSTSGSSNEQPPMNSPTTDDDDEEVEDESQEAIRERSRQAAEARFAGRPNNNLDNSGEQTRTVPGSFLQPDELD